MIFRTESLSAGAAGAPAATIVKAAAKAMAATCARLFGNKNRRTTYILTLSEHELRDVGLKQVSPGMPIAFDLLDLVPRGSHFSHRLPRRL
jgi:hypothetical protein